MKRRSKFTLSPRPAVSPKSSKPRLAPPKRESPKIQIRAAPPPPPPASPPPADAVEEEEVFEEEPVPIKLPRAQLELEFTAVAQERELLLNQLAGLLEELMVTVPAD
jgi:hypothetical protein